MPQLRYGLGSWLIHTTTFQHFNRTNLSRTHIPWWRKDPWSTNFNHWKNKHYSSQNCDIQYLVWLPNTQSRSETQPNTTLIYKLTERNPLPIENYTTNTIGKQNPQRFIIVESIYLRSRVTPNVSHIDLSTQYKTIIEIFWFHGNLLQTEIKKSPIHRWDWQSHTWPPH